jgi:hypothetical protein
LARIFTTRDDVALLLTKLGLRNVAEAEAALARYYPLEQYPAKARYVLEELLDGRSESH